MSEDDTDDKDCKKGQKGKRVIGRPQKRGQSGNPSGRPKDPWCVAETARQLDPKALAKLESLMDNPDVPYHVQDAAACSIFDRGFGRPVNLVQHHGTMLRASADGTQLEIEDSAAMSP